MLEDVDEGAEGSDGSGSTECPRCCGGGVPGMRTPAIDCIAAMGEEGRLGWGSSRSWVESTSCGWEASASGGVRELQHGERAASTAWGAASIEMLVHAGAGRDELPQRKDLRLGGVESRT